MDKGARQRLITANEVIKNAKPARGTVQAAKQAAEVAKLLYSSHGQVRISAAEFIGDMHMKLPEESCISLVESIGKQLQQPDPGIGRKYLGHFYQAVTGGRRDEA